MSSQQNSKQLLKWVHKMCLEQRPASSFLITAWFSLTYSARTESFILGYVGYHPHTLKLLEDFAKVSRQDSWHEYISSASISIWKFPQIDLPLVEVRMPVEVPLQSEEWEEIQTNSSNMALGIQEREEYCRETTEAWWISLAGWGGGWDPGTQTFFSQGQQTFQRALPSQSRSNCNWEKNLQKTLLLVLVIGLNCQAELITSLYVWFASYF